MSTSRRRTASVIVLTATLASTSAVELARAAPAPAALIAAKSIAGPTRSPASAVNGQTRWTSEPMPVADASLFNATQIDQHTTWAYGVQVAAQGLAPLLLAKDDRDARGWTAVPTVPVTGSNRINSVSAVSARDAWLVGDFDPAIGGIVTGHWDGTEWRTVAVPLPDKAYSGGLLSVSAHASDDVWAAGWAEILDSREPDPDKPGGWIDVTHSESLLEHWNGKTWQREPAPDPTVALSTVTAVSRNDVWAAGNTNDDQPALLHFDGRTWSTVPAPRYAGRYGEFNSLATNGPNDVWAIGRVLLDDNDRGHALVAHWDGHRWQQITTPADAGRLWNAATVPGGIAVVGSTPSQADGYGMRLTDNRWNSLGIPVGNTTHTFSYGVLYSAGKLAVIGSTRSDQSPEPQPLVLTGTGLGHS